MNIWEWVREEKAALRKAGEGRLVDLLDALPSAVCAQEHARADAIVPEALALARRLDHRWLEVFIRHWDLQSRILMRADVGSALGDAVRLLDFAHEEPTRECPQGVCAVQDLAVGYALVDGPGFVDERLAVTKEILARIDPAWPCFQCVSLEHGEAIRDGGDAAGSLAYLDAQLAAVEALPGRRVRNPFVVQRVESLMAMGRVDEALAYLEARWKKAEDKLDELRCRLLRAQLLARLGRHAEATREMPPIKEVAASPVLYAAWGRAVRLLVPAGAIANTWQLGATLRTFAARLADQGVVRYAIELWHTYADLALARGAKVVAARAAVAIESLLPRLAKPLDAPAHLAELRARIDAAPATVGAADATDALDEAATLARAEGDPEHAVEILAPARARLDGSEAIAVAYARALSALGWTEEASAALHAFLRAHPDAPDVVTQLAEVYVHAPSPEPLAALEREVTERATDPATRGRVSFYRGLRLRNDRQYADSNRALEPALALLPESVNTRLLFAANCASLRDFAGALARLDEAVAMGAAPGPLDWDRMTAAAIVGAWGTLRASATRLGITLPGAGEGEVSLDGELCRLELPALPTDKPRVLFARRTSPVTARVLFLAAPSVTPQEFGDVWAFDAAPRNAPPAKGEEREHTFVYPAVHRLREGHYSVFALEGAYPGDDVIAALRAQLAPRRIAMQVFSDEDHHVEIDGQDVRGLYARLALPPEVPAGDLAAILGDALAGVVHPLLYLGLAEATGDAGLVAEHEARAERYESA